MIFSLLMVGRQLLILFVIAIGAGYWLWRAIGAPKRERTSTFLWLGVAGLCLVALLLQGFVYLGLPLRLTAWPAFAAGVTGLVLAFRRGFQRRTIFSKEARLYALVFVGSFVGQSTGLLGVGPDQFFGRGFYDQANYVVTAEFLRSEKFATSVEEVGYRPWLLRALETKEQRITPCVMLGALAEIDRSSAQECYGTVNSFFVALMGVATSAWLRRSGLGRGAAGWAGVGAALTPALTRIHLDGFFSQTATLFVCPALAGALGGRLPLTRGAKICTAILLAFFLGSYSEVAAFGFALAAALVLARGVPWRARVFEVAGIFAAALLLNLGYLGRLVEFLFQQAGVAANPRALAALFPESGTWIGWGRMFVDLPWPGLVVVAGIVVGVLGLWGVMGGARSRRWQLIAIVGVALLPLLLLRSLPQFPSYPFGKLAVQFVPIWVGAAMVGLVSLMGNRSAARKFVWGGGCLGATAAWITAMPLHREVIHPSGRLEALSSDALLQQRHEAESNPARAYLVVHRDPLMAQWLCYLGRKNLVVFDSRTLGDRVVPTETYPFRRWTLPVGDLWWLDPDRSGPVANYEPPPTLRVQGAKENDRTKFGAIYEVTGSADFVFDRPLGGSPVRVVWFDFLATPVVENQPLELVWEGPGSARDVLKTIFTVRGLQRWRVALAPGESKYRLRVTAPGGAAANATLRVSLLSVEVAGEVLASDPKPSGI